MIITIVTLFITLVTKSHDPSSRVVGLLTFKVFFFFFPGLLECSRGC